MATEFICAIRSSTGDYSSLTGYHTACVDGVDFTSSATKVFGGSVTGIVSDGASVTLYRSGVSQSVTGTAKHDTATQVLVTSISNPSFSFQAGDEWRVDASNLFTISDGGDSVIPVAEGYNDWASGLVDQITDLGGGGCTLSATNYLVVRAASSAGSQGQSIHDGTGLVGWRVRPTSAYPAMGVTGDFVHLQDFIIDSGGYGGTGSIILLRIEGSAAGTSGDIRVERMVLRGQAAFTGTYQYGLRILPNASRTGSLTVKVSNTLVYDCEAATMGFGVHVQDNISPRRLTCYLYDVTAVDNMTYGFYLYRPGDAYVRNCLGAHTFGSSYYDFYASVVGGTDTVTSQTCCDTDGTLGASPWNGGSGHRSSQTPTFANRAGDDYHLASSDAACKDYGTNLSGDGGYPISVDIDNVTRSGSWDIGCDEYTAGVYSLAYDEQGSGADEYDVAPEFVELYDEAGSGSDAYVIARSLPAPTDIYINETWDTAQSGDTNPSGIADQTPVFSAKCYKRDHDVTHVRVQVATDAGFSNVVWDSGFLELATPISVDGTRTPDIEYGESGQV